MTVLFQVPDGMFNNITDATGWTLGATPDIVIDTVPIEYGGRWVEENWTEIEFESEKQRDWFVLRWS